MGVAASYWHLANEMHSTDFMESPRLSHACEYETSMMMALRLDWIKGRPAGHVSKTPSPYYDPLHYNPPRVVVCRSFDQITPNGAMGSPEKATAEKGEKLFKLIADSVVGFLKDFAKWKESKGSRKGQVTPRS